MRRAEFDRTYIAQTARAVKGRAGEEKSPASLMISIGSPTLSTLGKGFRDTPEMRGNRPRPNGSSGRECSHAVTQPVVDKKLFTKFRTLS